MLKSVAILIILISPLVFNPSSASEFVDPVELRKTISGNTLQGKNINGMPYHIIHSKNGQADFVVENGQFKDHGIWWIKDDASVCYRWKKIGHGTDDCFKDARFDEKRGLHWTRMRSNAPFTLSVLEGKRFNFK